MTPKKAEKYCEDCGAKDEEHVEEECDRAKKLREKILQGYVPVPSVFICNSFKDTPYSCEGLPTQNEFNWAQPYCAWVRCEDLESWLIEVTEAWRPKVEGLLELTARMQRGQPLWMLPKTGGTSAEATLRRAFGMYGRYRDVDAR